MQFRYQLQINEIDFDDIKVSLSSEIEKYREDIEKTLKNYKWFCRMMVDSKPDENLLKELQKNKFGDVSVNDIKAGDIDKIYYEVLMK